MKSRHRAREVALQFLYRSDVAHAPAKGTATPDQKAALVHEISQHFDHFHVPEDLREFSAQLASGTLLDQKKLDELLETHASNWKVSRMGLVDRSILRMALYEMLHFPETPFSVVIDEAVELAKQFGTADTPGFVNGVLDGMQTAVRGLIHA